YLTTQLIVNAVFGTTVGVGLYFIGIPTAFLWGALAAVLRFVPYVGGLFAAFCPVVLALAVSPGWEMVFLTITLFVVLDVVTGYFLEPLLYRSSTGVSSLALIIAAIFWTWLWGPIGLLLSTPLTVCLAVLGRHVPRLAFFSILLGNEEALSPTEECYHRLLVGQLGESGKVVDAYLSENSLTALYDQVIIPTVTMAEVDFQLEELDEAQRSRVLQGAKDLINDLTLRPPVESHVAADKSVAEEPAGHFSKSDCRVFCISPRGERDEVAGTMLSHLLQQQGFEAVTATPNLPFGELVSAIGDFKADVLCISVIPPTTLIHARHLCSQLRASNRGTRIMVGIWGATENLEDAIKGLRMAGADEVVVSLAEAVVQIVKFSPALIQQDVPARVTAEEEKRVAAVVGLKAYQDASNPIFDQMTKKLARTFNVPIALLTLIDRDRQHFKSAFGLPEELSEICDIPRGDAVCNHVVADNSPLVVEDLSRDRRFAGNALFKKHHLRFYAGIPLHAPDGQPVGALCILDTKPRKFSEADQRLFDILGGEISESLAPPEPNPPLAEPLAVA
ncbi:MAG: AI-2E family transporter, partial [Opitutaceae bacterium]